MIMTVGAEGRSAFLVLIYRSHQGSLVAQTKCLASGGNCENKVQE